MTTYVASARRWAAGNVPGAVGVALLALGVLVLIGKWLLVTAALLVVPFGLWWVVDRAQRRSLAPVAPPRRVASTAPRRAPATLPGEVRVTVTREEDHQHVLARHHRAGSPAPTRVVVDLVSGTVGRGKYRGAYAVEVRLGGERVGELTAAMSRRYAPVVLGTEGRGDAARAGATISHDARGLQVDLMMPTAS